MSGPTDLTVIILAFNEEKHLGRCLRSVAGVARRAVVIDCYSTDNTVSLARSEGAEVFQHAWTNYATQFNWALDNVAIETPWTMRLDADEVLTPELAVALGERLSGLPADVCGLTLNRRIHFLGRWIRHGGIYPIRMLRVWRTAHARCENRWMDEHMVVKGGIAHIDADIADINLNNVTWWTQKHNSYASREAVDLLMLRSGAAQADHAQGLDLQTRLKRWVKVSVYARLPLGIRPFLYFIYRYFLRLGFLDGWEGLAFHFLQGFWYRFLVDVKIHELNALMKQRGFTLAEAVRHEFGYEI